MALSPTDIDTLKDEILKLSQQPKHFYRLALQLQKLRAASAGEFQELTKSGAFSRRRAYQLLKIADFFEPLKISAKELEAVGFTKLHVIAVNMETSEFSKELIFSFANNHTVRELSDYAKSDATKKRVFTLSLAPDDYALYRQALLTLGAEPHGKGLRHQEQALMKLIKAAAAAG